MCRPTRVPTGTSKGLSRNGATDSSPGVKTTASSDRCSALEVSSRNGIRWSAHSCRHRCRAVAARAQPGVPPMVTSRTGSRTSEPSSACRPTTSDAGAGAAAATTGNPGTCPSAATGSRNSARASTRSTRQRRSSSPRRTGPTPPARRSAASWAGRAGSGSSTGCSVASAWASASYSAGRPGRAAAYPAGETVRPSASTTIPSSVTGAAYCASSAWQRRQVSTWRRRARSAVAAPSTISGRAWDTSSHCMSVLLFRLREQPLP